MEPGHKVVTPRKEVREGRSFNPDEFAIALEQVVAGTAPEDYKNPEKFFSRTYFSRALREHTGMVLRRLSGKTESTAPILTLITQFGGGKTHTLTALYHLVNPRQKEKVKRQNEGVENLLREAGLSSVPEAKVAVFVGNAWDPKEGRENPWIDIARQLAGDKGVELLGTAAKTSPPGTETIGKIFQAAGGPVLILFDEVLNFLNRHRNMSESFYAFFDNINRATTGTTHCAAVMSLPRSQMEMTEWDSQWQDKITKVVRRVAKDLIANDETEISEVIRRRLFEDLGSERIRKNVAKAYSDWCFERRERLPSEWTAVDTAATEAKARDFLRSRFEACYPFHPKGANISLIPFPEDGTAVQDSPKLTLVIIDPESEWNGSGQVRDRIAEWTKQRGKSPRLYPGSLVWCLKKPGRDLRDKVELSLAWKRVANEVAGGTLGADYDRTDRAEIQSKVREAEESARDEVWAGYRFVVLSDNREGNGLKVIDLGAGHASGAETLCGRVLDALRSHALLNVSVGAGYIDRNWPPALKDSGAWPLASLRQSFLNGALTRLPDPDAVLRTKIPDFVLNGDFGLASGPRPNASYDHIWFEQMVTPDEVAFDAGVFLLTKEKAKQLKGQVKVEVPLPGSEPEPPRPSEPGLGPGATVDTQTRTLRLVGTVPPEVWNRLGTKLIPKLKSGSQLKVGVEFHVTVDGPLASTLESEIRQILDDLGLTEQIRLEK